MNENDTTLGERSTADAPTSDHPTTTKVPVTIGRAVHVYRREGWRRSLGVGTDAQPQHGVVVNAWPGSANANIEVRLDRLNYVATEDQGLVDGVAASIPVFDSLTPEQRRQIGHAFWAEWPPRV